MPDSAAHAPTFALLAACARREFTPSQSKPGAAGIDWQQLPHLARRHGITPLVCRHLESVCSEAPQSVLAYLGEQFRLNAERNLRYTRAMLELLCLLEAHGIRALAFKGPILAAQAYRNPALRYFSDLDLLIHRRDLPEVTRLLAAQGYARELALRCAQPGPLARYVGECHLVHPAKPELDLHWRLLPGAVTRGFDSPHLWDRIESVRLAGRQVLTLSRGDLLLYLCVHGAKHLWKRLGWVCDVAGLIATHPPIDWLHLLVRAEEHGCRRMLFLGLALAHDLAGAQLDPELSRAMRRDPALDGLLPRVRRWIENGEAADLPLAGRIRFQLDVIERPRDKAAFLLCRILVPTIADLELLSWTRTPASFFYAVRPLRLLAGTFLRNT